LREGGIMAIHDTVGVWPGPRKVAREFVYKSKNFRNIRVIGSITFAEKVRHNSLRDMIRNRCSLFLIYILEFLGKFHLLEPIRVIRRKFIKWI